MTSTIRALRPALAITAGALMLSAISGADDLAAAGPTSIFVSDAFGVDTAGCGLSHGAPCATIAQGIGRAVTEGASCVYVQAGTYSEVVVLSPGVNLIGGFDTSWVFDVYDASGHTVTILGGYDGDVDQYLALRGSDVNVPTTVSNLVVQAPDAVGTVSGNGRSSYGVYLTNSSDVHLQDLLIDAGDGADGSDGADGTGLVAMAIMDGNTGGNADAFSTSCNSTSRGSGGSGGNNPCAGGTAGGVGGAGGTMDSDCSFPFDFDATPGLSGFSAAFVSGPFGVGGGGGSVCQAGLPGGPGLDGSDGAGGVGGPSGGFVNGGFWFGLAGASGGVGDDGTGGGGGGGSGGCDLGTDCYGAGGGGGGAGGCPAPTAGQGGGGGGGSFGVFAVNSTFSAAMTTIIRGAGGRGGAGGSGGAGQSGGTGGQGGSAVDDCGAGGDGGDGGRGGHSGGGGGGAGGDSFGILLDNSNVSAPGVAYIAGSPGVGGAAGFSPGISGSSGDNGDIGDVAMMLPPLDAAPPPRAGLIAGLCPEPCVADNAPDGAPDGVVDVADLLAILADWGICIGCATDVDSNGVVDVADLLAILGAWGPC